MSIERYVQRVSFVAGLLCVSLLAGCAGQLTEDEKFARAYAKAEREESIRNFIYSCESGGNAIIYTGPSYQKLRDPVKYIPTHARLMEYQCVQAAALARRY